MLACLDAGHETLAAMVPEIYQGLDHRLFPAAARSTFATLIHLTEQGRVAAPDGLSLEGRFQRA